MPTDELTPLPMQPPDEPFAGDPELAILLTRGHNLIGTARRGGREVYVDVIPAVSGGWFLVVVGDGTPGGPIGHRNPVPTAGVPAVLYGLGVELSASEWWVCVECKAVAENPVLGGRPH